MVRYFDDSAGPRPHYLWDFMGRILVECPNCGSCAVVDCARGLKGTPRLTCAACALTRRGWPLPSEQELRRCVPRRCPTCNAWLGKARLRFRRHKRTVEAHCPCGAVCSASGPRVAIVLGESVDPYFRLPLWLRAEVKGNTLWAYNREHLSILEAYVRADVRRRAPNWNASLVSRLPRWLKAASMRQVLLRTIDRVAHR
jgi:hypothetical protein